jgi:hypothetical protein
MDVEYLRANSVLRNTVIFADSSTRDKAAWPRPSEYTISFDQPYRNVVSMNVLDATIPATMYVVDSHNDTLRAFARLGGSDGAAAAEAVGRLQGLLLDAQAFPPVRGMFSGPGSPEGRLKFYRGSRGLPDPPAEGAPAATGVAVGSADVYPVGEGFDYGGAVPAPHALVADSLSVPGPPPESSRFRAPDGVPSVLLDVTVPSAGTTRCYAPLALWDAGDAGFEFPGGASFSATYATGAGGETVVRLVSLAAFRAPQGPSGDAEGLPHAHELAFWNIRLERGNYDAEGFARAFEHAAPWDPLRPQGERKAIDIGSPSKIFLKDTPDYMRYSNEVHFLSNTYPFWFDMEASGLDEVLGFTELAGDAGGDGYSRLAFGGNRRIFGALPELEGKAPAATPWRLRSPGLLNLNGVRFVILRCPQIEDAFPNYSGQGYGAGIGLFKLYDQTLSHLRFDFVKFNHTEFHPIGKLSRLHLRFERLGGELYDFKGTDFHVLLVISHLEPARPRFASSALDLRAGGDFRHLNPDYDPDVVRYAARTRQELDESDTQSDASLLADAGHRERFLRRRARMRASPGGPPGAAREGGGGREGFSPGSGSSSGSGAGGGYSSGAGGGGGYSPGAGGGGYSPGSVSSSDSGSDSGSGSGSG